MNDDEKKLMEQLKKENEKYKKEAEATKAAYEGQIKELTIAPKIKDAFVDAGGNKVAFEAFYKVNGDKLKSVEDYKPVLETLKKEQEYFFTTSTPSKPDVNINNEINKAPVPAKDDINDQFYDGTLTRKPK